MKDRGRNHKQIRLEGAESKTLEREGEILLRSSLGDLERETNDVERPEVKIAHAFPEELGSNGLSVVHSGFRGVFSDHPVDYDSFFPVAIVSTGFELF